MRLTHLKVTGGSLRVKMVLKEEEKVDQIRIYSGSSYRTTEEVEAGRICVITGPDTTRAGEGLGAESEAAAPMLTPVLNYQIELPEGCDVHGMFLKLKQLEEEIPELHIVWDRQLNEIHAQVMGEVQIEILKSMILERFQVDVEFGTGNIVYTATFSANNENRPPIGNKAMEDVDMGDFYFIDGSFADKSTELTSTQKSVCIGVVLKKGRDNSGDWADNCNYTLKDGTTLMPEVHGYVLALRDVKGIIVWSQPWSNIEVGCDRNPTTGFNGYSNTRAIINAIEEHGWTLQREFPAAYYAVNYENVCPAPAKTSGWFLPSGGQCQYWLNNKDVIHNSMLNAEGDGCFGLYWSSSEDADNPVSNAYYLDSCPGYDKIYSEWKISSNAVRACLAF